MTPLVPSRFYVLDGHEPVAADMTTWSALFAKGDRQVAVTQLGEIRVSTVFLGLDHNLTGRGRPILFETMVFGGRRDGWTQRYCTWAEAEAGHAETVAMVERAEERR